MLDIKTIFDPANLFIAEADWLDEEKQDAFLEHLLNNLRNIDDYDISWIYWTNELEEFLWSHPQLPPWRLDRDWKLKLVPIIYKVFAEKTTLVDSFEDTYPCKVQPKLKHSYNKPEIHKNFLCLVDFLIAKENKLFFCVGLENQLATGKKYIFSSDSHSHHLTPILINTANDWLFQINLTKDYWPTAYTATEIEKFRTAIEITSKTRLLAVENNFHYSYSFDKKFIENIGKEQKYRQAILDSVTKRLFRKKHLRIKV